MLFYVRFRGKGGFIMVPFVVLDVVFVVGVELVLLVVLVGLVEFVLLVVLFKLELLLLELVTLLNHGVTKFNVT